MRVLLAAPSFGAYGGMEACLADLAETLTADSRFDVRVCFKRATGFRLHHAVEALAARYPVEFCDRASRRLWSAIRWADIVHGHSASPDIASMTVLQRKPFALSIHNVLPGAPRLRRLSWLAGARLASVRWYDSRFLLRTWEGDAEAPNSACVHPTSRRWTTDVPSGERKGFVFLGRLVPGKGVDVLLDAYHRAQLDRGAWPLTIIGDGHQREQLEAQAARRGATGVHFRGFVDGPQKVQIVASARWLVAPSHWQEPFGLMASEARRLGVPCIVTRDGGLPEAAGRDALVCEPADIDGLAALLRVAAGMPEGEYLARCRRTKLDLARELPPPGFYADEYLRLLGRRGFTSMASTPVPS